MIMKNFAVSTTAIPKCSFVKKALDHDRQQVINNSIVVMLDQFKNCTRDSSYRKHFAGNGSGYHPCNIKPLERCRWKPFH